MPSSPKSKHTHISRITLLHIVLISCSTFLFFTATFWLGVVLGECTRRGDTWSVRVLWQKNRGSKSFEIADTSASKEYLGNVYVNVHGNKVTELGVKRHKVMAFVGIMTDYNSSGRRKSLRKAWMPSDQQSLQRMEESTGLAFRFIIGNSNNSTKSQELHSELLEYDDFMVLDCQEENIKPPYKTYLFLKAAYAFFECDFYVKVQDDIYLRPDRLSLLLAKDRPQSRTYLGCMTRTVASSDSRPRLEKQLTGSSNVPHAQRSIFALSYDIVADLLALGRNSLRMFHSEDVTMGVWMLAMNVNYEDNRQLCETVCTSHSIVVTDFPRCPGLCEAEERMLELHEQAKCSKSPTDTGHQVLNYLEWGRMLNTNATKAKKMTRNRQFS